MTGTGLLTPWVQSTSVLFALVVRKNRGPVTPVHLGGSDREEVETQEESGSQGSKGGRCPLRRRLKTHPLISP